MLSFDVNEYIFEDEIIIKNKDSQKNFQIHLTYYDIDDIQKITEQLNFIKSEIENKGETIDTIELLKNNLINLQNQIYQIIFKNDLEDIRKTAKTSSLFNKIFETVIIKILNVQNSKNLSNFKKKN